MLLESHSFCLSSEVNTFFTTTEYITIDHWPMIKMYRCDYQLQAYHDDLFELTHIKFPDKYLRAVPKRRAEYLAGRYMAGLALSQLGIDHCHIGVGQDRSPVWPSNIVGSITHTSRCAYAAVSNSNDIHHLGIDYEHIIASKTIAEISPSIINNVELDFLKNNQLAYETAFSIVFSAKESLFKALYPSVNRYFDFSAAEVIALSPDGNFTLKLTEELSTGLPEGKCIEGYFVIDNQHVLTMVF